MVSKIKNHKTEHSIKKEGKSNKDVEEKKEISGKEKTTRRRKFKAVLDKDTPKKVKVNKNFKVDRNGGWENKKPNTKTQRKVLHEKCGDDAFLLPEHLKFPICNKILRKNNKCTYNCNGLKGASSRAGEWGYKRVLKNSKELTKELGCYKNKKKIESKKKIKEKKIESKKKGEKNFISKVFSIFQ